MGKKIIGAVGGIKIPPVDSYIAGYQYCANKAVPGTKTITQYSNSFTDEGKCSTMAQNEIGSGAQVIFQVAGLCGDGALEGGRRSSASGASAWTPTSTTSREHPHERVKKTDVGVEHAIQDSFHNHFQGGTNILLNLKNNGVGVGKISPKVPKSWIDLMNAYKAKIIAGTLKPPATLSK